MNRFVPVVAALLSLSVARASGPNWTTSWEAASKLSKETGLPVLAEFTGSDWCPPCKALDAEVFQSGVFQTWSKSHVVLLRLDYPKYHKLPAALTQANRAMLIRFRVEAFPTVLFLTPEGQIMGRYGYVDGGPTFWTKNAEVIIKAGRRPRA